MSQVFRACYFDGKVSIPHDVSLTYNDRTKTITFDTPSGISMSWGLDDLEIERYGTVVEIRNRQSPSMLLKVEDEVCAHDLFDLMRQSNNLDLHTRMVNLGFGKILAIASVFIVLIVLSYFFVLPNVAEKSVSILPDSVDDSVGDVFMNSFWVENNVDSLKTSYLEEFVSHLELENAKPLHFSIVNSSIVNAFASPNGQVVIYTGLLRKMKSSDELVALIGHEVSHINHRHSIKRLARSLSGYMLVSLVFSDVNGIMSVIVENAEELHQLSYSREFEQQADESGLDIMIRNNADPQGMIDLFHRLKDGDRFEIPEILSTHPLTDDRISHIEEMISTREYEVRRKEVLDSLFLRMAGTPPNP